MEAPQPRLDVNYINLDNIKTLISGYLIQFNQGEMTDVVIAKASDILNQGKEPQEENFSQCLTSLTEDDKTARDKHGTIMSRFEAEPNNVDLRANNLEPWLAKCNLSFRNKSFLSELHKTFSDHGINLTEYYPRYLPRTSEQENEDLSKIHYMESQLAWQQSFKEIQVSLDNKNSNHAMRIIYGMRVEEGSEYYSEYLELLKKLSFQPYFAELSLSEQRQAISDLARSTRDAMNNVEREVKDEDAGQKKQRLLTQGTIIKTSLRSLYDAKQIYVESYSRASYANESKLDKKEKQRLQREKQQRQCSYILSCKAC